MSPANPTMFTEACRRRSPQTNTTVALVLASVVLLSGCRSENPGSQDAAASAAPRELTVDLKDPNLAFIWVDSEGNFQTTTDRGEIPKESTTVVRLLGVAQAETDPEHVLVIDLSSGGAPKARSMPREEWEGQGKALRQARVDAARPRPIEPAQIAEGGLNAVVYGASWCKPCHLAEDYLKGKGIRVTKKDIEEDPGASAEMRQKLAGAGLGGASIPVLDVGGTILVGFSTSAVDRAIERALRK